jgi:hypothetical protein
MLFLTTEQHQEVLSRLVTLGKSRADGLPFHPAGVEYTSLMVCFLLHNLAAAETLLRVGSSFGNEWYPVTVAYAIARTMFETDVTAHYITQAPAERAHQYSGFSAILDKRQMDACQEHRNSSDPQWRGAMDLVWQHQWAPRQKEVLSRFDAAAPQFTRVNRHGKAVIFPNWTGKPLRQVATEVGHLEAYDIFYAELSSFAHADVHLADRFLRRRPDGPIWSQRAEDGDVGNVFRHAASFLDCYLTLFGGQFKTWTKAHIQACWPTAAPPPVCA